MSGYRRGLGPSGPGDVERTLDAEIESHLEMRVDDLMAEGLSLEAARAEALRRFGPDPAARRRLLAAARRARRRKTLRGIRAGVLADVRLAVRRAARARGFTAIALLVFALGVGLTTTVLAVADNVLFRPLPYPEADRLVALWSVAREGNAFPWVSMSNWADWREAGSLQSTAIHASRRAAVSTADDALRAPVARVAGAFFETLALRFRAGRGFTEEEAQAGSPVAVVSEGFWRRVLGGVPLEAAPSVVVDGERAQVVGVLEEGQSFPAGTDLWVPHRWRAGGGSLRNNINYEAVARLAPGADVERARRELDAIALAIRESDPEAIYSWGVGVRPLHDVVVREARPYLVMLLVAVGSLLVVACANLAGLGLARARRRAHETAVHLALGAGRLRLVRRAVVEHLLFALAGGAAGMLLAWLATDLILGRFAAVLPRADEIGFDVRVILLGVGAAVLAGAFAGIAPALEAVREGGMGGLSGARGRVRGGRGLPGAAMVGTEVALAVVLLVAGGLLLRSFQTLVSRELGFDPEGLVTADAGLVGQEWAGAERRLDFWRRAVERARALPGVSAAAVARDLPTSDGGRGFIDLPDQEGTTDIGAGYFVVGPEYFETMGIRLLRGRTFGSADGPGTERVTVVSRGMADRYWPGEDPLGRRVRARSMEEWISGSGVAPWLTVVGVVEDVRQYGFESTVEPDMYVLHSQVPAYTGSLAVVARSTGGSVGADVLRRAIREIDPGVAVEASTMDARLARLTVERRLVLSGLGIFGAASVLLVCLGIYGLVSFAAEERTREMAVRIALGSGRTGILRLMLGGALRVVLAGAVLGVGGGWVFTRLLEGSLVGVGSADPPTYAAAVLALTLVALSAAAVPGLRAARRDPLETLRSE